MKSKSEFWLTLHKLADDLDKEGKDDEERAAGIVAFLETSPPATLEFYLDNLERVTTSLNHVLAKCRVR